MAVNKVEYNDNGQLKTLIDLTADTVTADKLAKGYTAHDMSGNIITGTMESGSSDEAMEALKAVVERTNSVVTLPQGITEIGSYTFYRFDTLKSILLPSGLTEIGSYGFFRCNNLTSISLPESIVSLPSYAIYGCTNLSSITFQGTPSVINSAAFVQCGNLTTINVPWSEGEVAHAPWGADNATVNYNYNPT